MPKPPPQINHQKHPVTRPAARHAREAAEKRRGGIPAPLRKKNGDDGDRNVPAPFSLFFDDLLDAQLRTFNPRYAEAAGALLEQFRHLHTDIYGNREFVEHRDRIREEMATVGRMLLGI